VGSTASPRNLASIWGTVTPAKRIGGIGLVVALAAAIAIVLAESAGAIHLSFLGS
jgi:hypothetical protein